MIAIHVRKAEDSVMKVLHRFKFVFRMSLSLTGIIALFAGPSCLAQALILPQIADGANWRTAVILANTTARPTTASLVCYQETSGGAATPWTPPFVESSNTQPVSILAAGTLYLHTQGTAVALSQGWCELNGSGVVGYAIYTYGASAGRPDQDGTSQALAASNRILVPFDNTSGFVTSVAIANPTSSPETVSVNIQTDAGAISQTALPSLPANGHLAFATPQQFPAAAGRRGLAEFYVPNGGDISIAAFRFNPGFALTSSSVFTQIGPPIIGSSSSPGPAFLTLSLKTTFSPQGTTPGPVAIDVTPNSDGTYGAVLSGTFGGMQVSGTLVQGSAANDGQTFAFSAAGGSPPAFTSASLTFTITQVSFLNRSGLGNVSGSLSLTLPGGGTFSGEIKGTYVQTFPF
jgi:hypothetical protein